MVAATRDSTQPPQASPEDEALKRNTDCVYFLASPLTCKKGSECEYRHSESARVNPRDCWYWLNGSCLNPKCAFRHPPLDGLLGTQATTSAGSYFPTPQTAVAPLAAPNAIYNQGKQVAATNPTLTAGKQAVPCVFFQKGFCLKGDRCAFSHGPNPFSNKVLQTPVAAPVSEPPNLKKTFGGLEKCNNEQKRPQANISKPTEVPPKVKATAESESALSKNRIAIERNIPPHTRYNDEVSSHKVASVPSVANGNTMTWSDHMHHADVSDDLQNGKDADEFYRESSPGFDVLVDDELRDSDYYHEDDQFAQRGHEGRNMNEFDVGGSADYNSVPDVDREMFRDPRGYDSYEHMQGQYDWKQRRASSERMLVGSDSLDRRGYRKTESPDQIVESDLRHRLLKQRRVNGLRSVISQDYSVDKHDEERHRSSRRDSRHLPTHDSSFSSRLRGRIKIPGRSSPVKDNNLRPEREELDRGRSFGRLSPGRTHSSSHQGRLQDRVKERMQENVNNQERNFREPRMRRDIMTDRITDFSRPKSLAELKVNKGAENKEQHIERQEASSLGKRKNPRMEGHQPSESDLSFEGPKPLSEILKRKRGGETLSNNKEENNQSEGKESLTGISKTSVVTETHSVHSSITNKEASAGMIDVKEDSKSAKAFEKGDGMSPIGKNESAHGQFSQIPNVGELDAEEGMIVEEEGMDDQELEAYDQRDGEDYDYEQVEGADYNLDEGEQADPEEEYLDDEDGDDFAKKIGVMFS